HVPAEPAGTEEEMCLAHVPDTERIGHPPYHVAFGRFDESSTVRVSPGSLRGAQHRGQVARAYLPIFGFEARVTGERRGERLLDQVTEGGGEIVADRSRWVELGVQADQHPVVSF